MLPNVIRFSLGDTRPWVSLHRRTESIALSYDKLVDVLAAKDRSKLLLVAAIDREMNSQLESFLAPIAAIFEKIEAEKRPTIHFVVPSYYMLCELVKPSLDDCDVVEEFKVSVRLIYIL